MDIRDTVRVHPHAARWFAGEAALSDEHAKREAGLFTQWAVKYFDPGPARVLSYQERGNSDVADSSTAHQNLCQMGAGESGPPAGDAAAGDRGEEAMWESEAHPCGWGRTWKKA